MASRSIGKVLSSGMNGAALSLAAVRIETPHLTQLDANFKDARTDAGYRHGTALCGSANSASASSTHSPPRVWQRSFPASSGHVVIPEREGEALLLHDSICKSGRQIAPVPFDPCQRQRLRDHQRCNTLPWFRHCIYTYRQQLLRGLNRVVRHQHYTPTFAIAFCCQLDSKPCSASDRKDDCHVRIVCIQVWAVLKAGSGMRSRAEAAHFANRQRAHPCSAVSPASSNDLNVPRAAAELFHLSARRERFANVLRQRIRCLICVLLPFAPKNL